MTDLQNRYDVVFLFDVTNNAANEALDNTNLLPLYSERNADLVSNFAIKRAICNYTSRTRNEPRYRVLVQEDFAGGGEENAFAQSDAAPWKSRPGREDSALEDSRALVKFACSRFFDVRAFGAVLGEGRNAVQVRGPVQLTFASTVDPVTPLESAAGRSGGHRTYGLYRAHLFISPGLAAKTGFDSADMRHLVKSLWEMFEEPQQIGEGRISVRRVVAFEHASALGSAPAQSLFDRVRIARNERDGVVGAPRGFGDYAVTVDSAGLPEGIRMFDVPRAGYEQRNPTLQAELAKVSVRERLRLNVAASASSRPAQPAAAAR